MRCETMAAPEMDWVHGLSGAIIWLIKQIHQFRYIVTSDIINHIYNQSHGLYIIHIFIEIMCSNLNYNRQTPNEWSIVDSFIDQFHLIRYRLFI